jgi:tetratricopeptide (TPR) repeat protein
MEPSRQGCKAPTAGGSLLAALLAACAVASVPGTGRAQEPLSICGSIKNAYGPFDYRTDRDKLAIVESNHFTPPVESLIRGQTGAIGGDLDYTLRAFPNHHRALLAVMNLGKREKKDKTAGMNYTVECYFDRALRFASNDTVARSLYAIYLRERSRPADAERQLDIALQHAGDNALSHFNLGLQYFELKAYDKAAQQARAAQSLGLTWPELIQRLREAGRWVEPEAAAGAASAAASAAR